MSSFVDNSRNPDTYIMEPNSGAKTAVEVPMHIIIYSLTPYLDTNKNIILLTPDMKNYNFLLYCLLYRKI